MGWFDWLGQKLVDTRSNNALSVSTPQGWVDLFNGGSIRTEAGICINEQAAVSISTVYRCVSLIAGTMAAAPIRVLKISKDGREEDDQHPIVDLWNIRPNEWQTPTQFREQLVAHALLWGTGFAELEYDSTQMTPYPVAMHIIHPAYVDVEYTITKGKRVPRFKVTPEAEDSYREPRYVEYENMIVLPNLGLDGITGLSTISTARETLGLTLGAEKYGAQVFDTPQTPPGVLTHPTHISDAARKNIRESWGTMHSRRQIAILEEGVEFKPLMIPPGDAQFLSTRQFQTEEIARWYGVPLSLLYRLDNVPGTGLASLGEEFKIFTLTSWAKRLEGEIKRKLVLYSKRRKTEVLVGLEDVLFIDPSMIMRYLSLGVQVGLMDRNEGRKMLKLPPRSEPEAGMLLTPTNLGGPNNTEASKSKPAMTQDNPETRIGDAVPQD